MPDICDLKLKDLQPSQFYISERKLRGVNEWFRPEDLSNFEPIPVKMLDGIPVMTDGHTRAVAAVLAGLDKVPFVWDEDELSWEMYRRCVLECKARGIHNPADLLSQIISESEYREKWDAWCDEMQAEVNRSNTAGDKKNIIISTEDMNWSALSHEQKNHQLFLKQKALLDQFLEKGAISQAQHDKSLHDLIEKMGETC